MSASRPLASTSARVGSSMATSLRLAPSMAQPTGTPWRSAATDHFHPNLARFVGFGPVPSPPHGALCCDPVEGDAVEVEADDPVERGERFGLERLEHAGGDPLIASCSQGGV